LVAPFFLYPESEKLWFGKVGWGGEGWYIEII
jgi:hypothetical protein